MSINKTAKIIGASIMTGVLSVVFIMLLIQAVWVSPPSETTLASEGYDISLPDGPVDSEGIATSTNAHKTTVIPIHNTSRIETNKTWPEYLRIPSIGINAKVQHVGVGKSGSMAVPTNYTDVGWYRAGTVPGENGSAVFDGHVDNGLGLAGVFKHLADINTGDDIYITDENGKELHFKVSSVDIYDYKSVPTNLIFNQNDNAYIRLITCDGTWVKGDKTYNQRLVVSAIISP